MAKPQPTFTMPAILRVTTSAMPLRAVLEEAIDAGLPVTLSNGSGPHHEVEDASAVDPSLTTEVASAPPPQPGTSYAGLTPAQRHVFIAWSRQPETLAPPAYQQLYLANLEARLLETEHRGQALAKLHELGEVPMWRSNPAFHRTLLLACWLTQDGLWLADWISTGTLPTNLLGVALGMQALLNAPMTPPELGVTIAAWQLGARLYADLLKMRLDSLTAILGQPPLTHALEQLGEDARTPRLWRTAHRGLRLLIPQPDLHPVLEPFVRDALAVVALDEAATAPIGTLAALDTSQQVATSSAEDAEADEEKSLEELGWRLILEFGANRSEYFDYVLIQAQKLPGYSQIMDEDRRMVYRIIFRKSEMRRFWRIWDYVHGWTSTRVYLHGVELEKWKVWPYSQYLR